MLRGHPVASLLTTVPGMCGVCFALPGIKWCQRHPRWPSSLCFSRLTLRRPWPTTRQSHPQWRTTLALHRHSRQRRPPCGHLGTLALLRPRSSPLACCPANAPMPHRRALPHLPAAAGARAAYTVSALAAMAAPARAVSARDAAPTATPDRRATVPTATTTAATATIIDDTNEGMRERLLLCRVFKSLAQNQSWCQVLWCVWGGYSKVALCALA